MFFNYNEDLIKQLKNKKTHFIGYIIPSICISLIIVSVIIKELDMFKLMLILLIAYYIVTTLSNHISSRHPKIYVRKYQNSISNFKYQGISLGAELKEDHLVVRGLMFTEVSWNDTFVRNYFE